MLQNPFGGDLLDHVDASLRSLLGEIGTGVSNPALHTVSEGWLAILFVSLNVSFELFDAVFRNAKLAQRIFQPICIAGLDCCVCYLSDVFGVRGYEDIS